MQDGEHNSLGPAFSSPTFSAFPTSIRYTWSNSSRKFSSGLQSPETRWCHCKGCRQIKL